MTVSVSFVTLISLLKYCAFSNPSEGCHAQSMTLDFFWRIICRKMPYAFFISGGHSSFRSRFRQKGNALKQLVFRRLEQPMSRKMSSSQYSVAHLFLTVSQSAVYRWARAGCNRATTSPPCCIEPANQLAKLMPSLVLAGEELSDWSISRPYRSSVDWWLLNAIREGFWGCDDSKIFSRWLTGMPKHRSRAIILSDIALQAIG